MDFALNALVVGNYCALIQKEENSEYMFIPHGLLPVFWSSVYMALCAAFHVSSCNPLGYFLKSSSPFPHCSPSFLLFFSSLAYMLYTQTLYLLKHLHSSLLSPLPTFPLSLAISPQFSLE